MRPIIHFVIAWEVSNAFELKVWDRRVCAFLGLLADIDSFILFLPKETSWQLHVATHTLIFGLAASLCLSLAFSRGAKRTVPYFLAFSSHVLADMIRGSANIPIFYPFMRQMNLRSFGVPENVINILWWAAIVATFALLLVIFLKKRRTMMEIPFGELDSVIVDMLVLPWRTRCATCGSRAFFKCKSCGKPVCNQHNDKKMPPRCQECNASDQKLLARAHRTSSR